MNRLRYFYRILVLCWRKPGLMRRRRHNHKRRKHVFKRLKKRDEERVYRAQYKKRTLGRHVLPTYLKENKWEGELNFKLWSTKGARFQAARRCEDKANSSLWICALLTSYLIILSLIPFVPYPLFKTIPADLLSFVSTAISIILLAYSLVVSSREYNLQAHHFHDCSLRIGMLYNQLRQAKEMPDPESKRKEVTRISSEYDSLMPQYPNHIPIDYEVFQISKAEYFELTSFACAWRRIRYYLHTKALHHSVVMLPVLVIGWVIWWAIVSGSLTVKASS